MKSIGYAIAAGAIAAAGCTTSPANLRAQAAVFNYTSQAGAVESANCIARNIDRSYPHTTAVVRPLPAGAFEVISSYQDAAYAFASVAPQGSGSAIELRVMARRTPLDPTEPERAQKFVAGCVQ